MLDPDDRPSARELAIDRYENYLDRKRMTAYDVWGRQDAEVPANFDFAGDPMVTDEIVDDFEDDW